MPNLTFGGDPFVYNPGTEIKYSNPDFNPSGNRNPFSGFMAGLGFDMGRSTQSGAGRDGAVNTASVDGTAGFTGFLSGLTDAVLRSTGAQSDQGGATPVAYGGGSSNSGLPMSTIFAVAAVGAGVYFLSKS